MVRASAASFEYEQIQLPPPRPCRRGNIIIASPKCGLLLILKISVKEYQPRYLKEAVELISMNIFSPNLIFKEIGDE